MCWKRRVWREEEIEGGAGGAGEAGSETRGVVGVVPVLGGERFEGRWVGAGE
jgi:hypothetical protein